MGGRLLSHRVRLPAAAYVAEPLSIGEIDAHPDSARIWATIRQTREEADRSDRLDRASGREPGRD